MSLSPGHFLTEFCFHLQLTPGDRQQNAEGGAAGGGGRKVASGKLRLRKHTQGQVLINVSLGSIEVLLCILQSSVVPHRVL